MQAQKDAAREKIVLNGFQYGSVNDLSDALERCVGRLVADGDDARTLANEILRAASRTISGTELSHELSNLAVAMVFATMFAGCSLKYLFLRSTSDQSLHVPFHCRSRFLCGML